MYVNSIVNFVNIVLVPDIITSSKLVNDTEHIFIPRSYSFVK